MKSFLKNLLIISLFIVPFMSHASILNIAEKKTTPLISVADQQQSLAKLYKEIPDINNKEALKKYLEERLKIVSRVELSPDEIGIPQSTSLVSSKEKLDQETLSSYEKIYQASLKTAGKVGDTLNKDLELEGVYYTIKEKQLNTEPFVPDFPYVTVKLSDEKEIIAPAEEHIPYLLTTIKIESTGLLNIEEEIILVSNNQIFEGGFIRVLPKYTYSRDNKKRKIDITLNSVTVNDEELSYQITEMGNHYYIKPKENLAFPTGIFTYKFNYTVDRLIWNNDSFDEFYWSLTAKSLLNVVGSANALVILPNGKEFLAQDAIASTKQGLNGKRVTINALAPNVLGFADTEALDVGEDVYIYITLEKGTLITPDFSQKYSWFIQDYGAELFAFLALLMILVGYKVSLEQIRLHQNNPNFALKKSPALYRLINLNTFDETSLLSEILNLCAKSALAISTDNNQTVIYKKSDNLSRLTETEKKLINELFPNNETILKATKENTLKLKRAYQKLHYNVVKTFNIYKFKLYSTYLGFSLGMLIIGEIAAATLSVDPVSLFLIMFIFSLLILLNAYFFLKSYKKKYVNILIKLFTGLSIASYAIWLALYTSSLYSLLIILTSYVMISYKDMFMKRSRLLKAKIKETEDYKTYLSKNPEFAVNARDFKQQMPYILALNISSLYKNVTEFELIKPYQTLLKH